MLARSVRVMPNALDTREIFYTNLLLLGFDPVAMESREKIPFNRDMFALPNKKAMEVVMYFLFSKLNPKITHEEFRGCWPVKNKVDEQKFRKTCYNWISRLAKEESDTHFPRVVQSLFHSPGGDRFYNFLLLFSMYVLKIVMHRDHSKHVTIPTFPSKSIHNHAFSQVMSKSLQLQTSLHRKRFLDLTQYSLEVQQHWKSYAIELNKEIRSLKKKKREVEKHLQKEISRKGEQMAKSIAMSNDYQKQVDALQRTQQLQKVRGLWQSIDEFSSEHNPQIVDSILTNKANQYHLDATDVEVKIPERILREFERDIHMKRVSNTYISGKLNLISLVQLWNFSLNLMKENIKQDSVPGFDESSPKIKNDIHNHQGLLSNVQTLRSTLTKETIPDLKQSVEKLKTEVSQSMMKLDEAVSIQHQPSFRLGLGLLPATPPVSFMAAQTPASHKITSFQETLKRTPTGVSTPEVIEAWSESLGGRKPPATQKPQLSRPSRQIPEKKSTRSQKQPTQIPKPANIPTGITRNQHRVSKAREEKPHKMLLKKGMSSSARKQRPAAKTHEVLSSFPLDQKAKNVHTEPHKNSHKNYRKSDLARESATADVANQIIGVLSYDKPDSGGSSSQSSQSSTPQPQAFDNPMEAIDDTAFTSHDLIARTPASKESNNANHTEANDVQELDKDRKSTNTRNSSDGLFETILNQARPPLSAKTVRTVLFSSPDEQDYRQYDCKDDYHQYDSNNSRDDCSPQVISSNEITSHLHNQPLLPPFAFEAPKGYKEDDTLKQGEFNLLTPFSFATPLTHSSMRKREVDNVFTPLSSKVSQGRGANTKLRGTPKVDTLVHFTPAASQESGANIEPRGTPGTDTSIQFTPATSQGIDSLAKIHKGDVLASSFDLSRTLGEKLSLKENHTRTPGADVLCPPVDNSKTMCDNEIRPSNSFHGTQIDLLEPTIFNESNLSDDISESETSAPKRSPFGAVDISSDEEGKTQEPQTSYEGASKHSITTTKETTSLKEMKESDLMTRLKRIKEAQSYDFRYLPSSNSSFSDPHAQNMNPVEKESTGIQGVSMESAERRQQVKPGADTEVEFYKGTEGIFMPALPLNTRDTPTNGKPFEHKSNTSTPTSLLSERFLQESPGKEKNNSNFMFSLDSPTSPDTDPDKISTNDLSSPEEAPSRTAPERDLNSSVKAQPSSSVYLWNTGPSPISSVLKNDDKILWLTSNGTTSKGLPSDSRLSYEDFLNESVDTSFLVPGTPFKHPHGSHGGPRSPINDDHADKSPDNVVAIETVVSPAVGQLIEF